MARFLVSEYRVNLFPYEDLIIYEMGAGNGTLMQGVMDYIRDHEPEIYARTQYHTIEISPRLAALQRQRSASHKDKVKVHRSSIFDWPKTVEEPCFVLAFEVLDNLAHDVVRFTRDADAPPRALQCNVSVSSTGEFEEEYTPVSDRLIRDYLHLHQRTGLPSLTPQQPPLIRKLMASLPFSANLGAPIFVPSQALALLQSLKDRFPAHRLLFSDFSSLPDAIPGINSPVVQTRYKGKTVPCTTYLVQQGFFDIFFPTDFRLLSKMYDLIMNGHGTQNKAGDDSYFTPASLKAGQRKCTMHTATHRAFLERWGEVERTTLGNGENPMLDFYANADFAWTTAR